MFNGFTNFNQNIENWETTNVTDMNNMFYNNLNFNRDISNKTISYEYEYDTNSNYYIAWNTSNVSDMNNMFNGAEVFNQHIGQWNTSNVTDMNNMFKSAEVFNQNIKKILFSRW